jgi:hypothetical protein
MKIFEINTLSSGKSSIVFLKSSNYNVITDVTDLETAVVSLGFSNIKEYSPKHCPFFIFFYLLFLQ